MTERHLSLGPGVEFDLVRILLERWGDVASGIGDDAAVLELPPGERLVVSTDAAVDAVHFRREWMTPAEIGYRAATAALSDLAAMAATPRGLLVALTLPDDTRPLLGDLADGIGAAAREVGARIVGGNLSRGATFSVTCTVLGTTAAPVRRNAMMPGDLLYVTGVLGGPAAALRAWQEGTVPDPAWRERFVHPHARVAEARWLAQHGVRAMIDVSDGLVSELQHLAAASGVEVRIDLSRVPVLRGCARQDALHGGEEYELVVAAPRALDVNVFARTFALPLSEIGRARASGTPAVTAQRGDGELATADPLRVDHGAGHDHFSV